jgi:hypothetical protein
MHSPQENFFYDQRDGCVLRPQRKNAGNDGWFIAREFSNNPMCRFRGYSNIAFGENNWRIAKQR